VQLALAALAVLVTSGAAVAWSLDQRRRTTALAEVAARRERTAASVTAALDEARARTAEAWGLTAYPDRMTVASDFATAAVRRAEGFMTTGEPTDELRAEMGAVRAEVDDLDRHARLFAALTRIHAEHADRPNAGSAEARAQSDRQMADAFRAFGLDVRGQPEEEVAAGSPEKYGRLRDAMDRTGRIDGVYRQLKTLQQAEILAAERPPWPGGTYRVIVADPPWAYEKRPRDPSQRGATPYPSMSLDEIKALPVDSLAANDAVVWLWTTNAHLPDAFEVLRAWGFHYKTTLTWVKDRMGCGDWLRGQTEHVLLAARGRPIVNLTNQTTVLYGRVRGHSCKPESFFELVAALCPGSKVELFARSRRPGWAAHGDQADFFGRACPG
jgi:N6-adenosine-specific RNA methylase IME4